MRVCILILLLNFVGVIAFAQDKILLTDSTVLEGKVIEISEYSLQLLVVKNDSTKNIFLPKYEISKLMFSNGLVENINPLIVKQKHIEPKKKLFLRLYLTDILTNKLSFGIERKLNNKYSIELDGFHKYAVSDNGYYVKHWGQAMNAINKGYEVRAGLARHFIIEDIDFSLSGLISYREQYFNDETFDAYFSKNGIDKGVYRISQNKKGFGLFLKLNLRPSFQNTSWEFFILPGIYAANTVNNYISYKTSDPPYNWVYDQSKIPHLNTFYMKDGFALIPYINLGYACRLKQPEKGEFRSEYNKLAKERDSLKFNRKNVITFNFSELIDGAFGLSYMRIIYKHGLNINTSLAVSNGMRCQFSNGTLLEGSWDYKLQNKQFDGSIAVNYNLSIDQQSFFFLGPQFRYARFDGYYFRPFILDKYYAFGNIGFLNRTENGLSFLVTLSAGKYFNDYINKDPNYTFTIAKPRQLNAINFSIQLGYSF
ncbi:MAG: hypothetical protein ACK50A_14835 [Sphingobacteriaceae bacterium]